MKVLQRILIFFAFYTINSYGGHPHDGDDENADPLVNFVDYIPPSLEWNSTYVRRLPVLPPWQGPSPVRPPVNPSDGETRMFIKLSSVGDVRPAEASIKNVILQINNGPTLLSKQASSMKGVPFNRGKSPDWEILSGKTRFMSWYGTLRPWGRTSQFADLYGDGEGLIKEILVPISADEIEQVKLSVDLRFGRGYDNPNRKYVMEIGTIENDSYVSLASVSAAPTINSPGHRGWQTYQASRDNTPPPLNWLGWDPKTRTDLERCDGDCDGDHQCPEGNICGGSTYPGTRIAGCGNLITTGQGGNYCYDPHYLSDYGVDAYDTHKPLLLCEGNCRNDSECGRGLICSRSFAAHTPYGCFRGQSRISNHGYCVYPVTIPLPFERLASIDRCTRCDDDHACPETLSCTAARYIEHFDPWVNAWDFVPGCTSTGISWDIDPSLSYTPGDKYCTIPLIKDVVSPGRQLQHCEGPCTTDDQCVGDMECYTPDGNVEVSTCLVESGDGTRNRNNSVQTSSRSFAGVGRCKFPRPPLTPFTANQLPVGSCKGQVVPPESTLPCVSGTQAVTGPSFGQVFRMCGRPFDTAGVTMCLPEDPPRGRCPRRKKRFNDQRISREQRFSGEPHCCQNFGDEFTQQPPKNGWLPGGGSPCWFDTCNDNNPGFIYIVRVAGDEKKDRVKIGCAGQLLAGWGQPNCWTRFKAEFNLNVKVQFVCIQITNNQVPREMKHYSRYLYKNDNPELRGVHQNCNAAEKILQDWFYCKEKWMGRKPNLHEGAQTGPNKGRSEWFEITMEEAVAKLDDLLYKEWRVQAYPGSITILNNSVKDDLWYEKYEPDYTLIN